MAIIPRTFVRKPFHVEAVQVTEENIEELAKWCGGRLRNSPGPENRPQRYIKVNVKKPLNERQTRAYLGDWVVTAAAQYIRGFKVYIPQAFSQSFDEVTDDMVEVLERTAERVEREERAEAQEETLAYPEFSNPTMS